MLLHICCTILMLFPSLQLNVLRNLYGKTLTDYYTEVRQLNATVSETQRYGRIGNMFRPIQPLEDRSLYYVSLPVDASGVNRPTTRKSVILSLLLMLCKVFADTEPAVMAQYW